MVVVYEQKSVVVSLSAADVPRFARAQSRGSTDNPRSVNHDRPLRVSDYDYLMIESVEFSDQPVHLFRPIARRDDNCQIQTKFTMNQPKLTKATMKREFSQSGTFL